MAWPPPPKRHADGSNSGFTGAAISPTLLAFAGKSGRGPLRSSQAAVRDVALANLKPFALHTFLRRLLERQAFDRGIERILGLTSVIDLGTKTFSTYRVCPSTDTAIRSSWSPCGFFRTMTSWSPACNLTSRVQLHPSQPRVAVEQQLNVVVAEIVDVHVRAAISCVEQIADHPTTRHPPITKARMIAGCFHGAATVSPPPVRYLNPPPSQAEHGIEPSRM